MEQAKDYLKISGIINTILGSIVISIYPIYGTFLFVIGIILYLYSKEEIEKIKENNNALLVIAIILIPCNFISSIFTFLANSSIQNSQKINGKNGPPVRIKRVMDPESRKVDILLKIGVLMVFISGILFATNSWDFISDFLKVIILIILGGLFLSLSFFTERKLKLYRSSYMYWILSMSFFLFSIISTLYFGIFSLELVYTGSAKALSYFITFITITGLSIATYLKFPKKYLLYLSYASALLSIVNILRYFIDSYALITIIISVIAFSILALNKKESLLSNFVRIISYSFFPFIITNMSEYPTIVFIAAIVNIALLNYITIKYKDTTESIISLIITYILVISSVSNLDIAETGNLVIFILLTINTIFIRFNFININKAYHIINYIMYIIISLIIITTGFDTAWLTVLISIICLLMNILESYDNKNIPIAKYIEPLLVLLTCINILNVDIIKYEIELDVKILITSMIYCIINYLTKDKTSKLIYYVSIIITLFFSISINTYIKEILPAALAIIPAIYLYHFVKSNEDNKAINIISYIVLISTIYNALCHVNITTLPIFINSLIMIIILCLYVLLSKTKYIKTISYFLITIPLFKIIEISEFEYDIQSILVSITGLYITFLVMKFLAKTQESRSILGVIGIVLSLLTVVSESYSSIMIGLYIGIIGLGVIIIGYYSKELKYFFTTGIVITIINIIYQLKDFWHLIPFWLYLLIGGLSLIGFVTYKEVKKNNKK